MSDVNILGRVASFFQEDIDRLSRDLCEKVSNSSFLVIGAAGSIGRSVTREIFMRNPRKIHAVDISENNLVELVRGLRSEFGYISGDFSTFAIDCGSPEFEAFWDAHGGYDYVLNLSALKHVRSEKDPFTLSRMIEVNIFNAVKVARLAQSGGAQKYFCVSTDKAANPANLMGATKRIMELFLARESENCPISMARFANVAFSDGSLLHGFNQRFLMHQPITAPNDILRYFVSQKEAGELCLISCLFAKNREILFPKMLPSEHLIKFTEIAERFLLKKGYKILLCETEEEARAESQNISQSGAWPCYFFSSDTTGEKEFEEFYTNDQYLDLERFDTMGVIREDIAFDAAVLDHFEREYYDVKYSRFLTKQVLMDLIFQLVPEMDYVDKGKYLDQRM